MHRNDITEHMFHFPGGNGVNLLGFTHIPERQKKNIGIVYCHPFGEEKNCSHLITANAAREFAAHGYSVLRFDYSGCGDSEGAFEDFSLEDWCDDISEAIRQLKERSRIDQIILWGLRLGASLAILNSAYQKEVKALLLWQPVLDLETYVTQFLRYQVGSNVAKGGNGVSGKSLIAELEAGETIEVFGYRLNPMMYDSFVKLGKTPVDTELQCPIYVSSISQMESAPFAMKHLIDAMRKKCPGIEFIHITEEPFWDRYFRWQATNVIAQSVQWLERCSAST